MNTLPSCLPETVRIIARSRAEAGSKVGERPSRTQRECRAMVAAMVRPGGKLKSREAAEVDELVFMARSPRVEVTAYQAPAFAALAPAHVEPRPITPR